METNHEQTFGLPPRMISVPLPAMLVDIVIAYFLPAWATISASRAAYWRTIIDTDYNIKHKYKQKNSAIMYLR